MAGGVSTDFFDAPWAWELQLHQDPDAEPPGLQDPDPPLPGTDPDGGPEDLGIYGGVDADQWDLDGDGAPQAWQPGGYDALTPAEAAGLDCNDTSPFVWNGSPWGDCPWAEREDRSGGRRGFRSCTGGDVGERSCVGDLWWRRWESKTVTRNPQTLTAAVLC